MVLRDYWHQLMETLNPTHSLTHSLTVGEAMDFHPEFFSTVSHRSHWWCQEGHLAIIAPLHRKRRTLHADMFATRDCMTFYALFLILLVTYWMSDVCVPLCCVGFPIAIRQWNAGSVVRISTMSPSDISAIAGSCSRQWQNAVISTWWALKKHSMSTSLNWRRNTVTCSVFCIQTSTPRNVTYVSSHWIQFLPFQSFNVQRVSFVK